jgi:hypothetical protein
MTNTVYYVGLFRRFCTVKYWSSVVRKFPYPAPVWSQGYRLWEAWTLPAAKWCHHITGTVFCHSVTQHHYDCIIYMFIQESMRRACESYFSSNYFICTGDLSRIMNWKFQLYSIVLYFCTWFPLVRVDFHYVRAGRHVGLEAISGLKMITFSWDASLAISEEKSTRNLRATSEWPLKFDFSDWETMVWGVV